MSRPSSSLEVREAAAQQVSEVKTYAAEHLDQLMHDMLESVFVQRPSDPLDYMIDFLTKIKNKRDGIDDTTKLSTTRGMSRLSVDRKSFRRRRRVAVSSEATGLTSVASSQWPALPKIAKTPSQIERIKSAILGNVLFSAQDDGTIQTTIDAMEEELFVAGDVIIEQGHDGAFFYVVDRGTADCFVNDKLVKSYHFGESFGELALMYKTPRAATIRATSKCVLWRLDRLTFRRTIMESTQRKRAKYEDILRKIPVLESLDQYERSKIADALEEEQFQDGEFVIRQGEPGENLYFVISGHAKVTKPFGVSAHETTLLQYGPGDYFGELALLNNHSRAANVMAQGELVLGVLDRASFTRLLGPLEQILQRNAENYQKIEKQIRAEMLSALAGGIKGDTPGSPKNFRSRRRQAVSSEPMQQNSDDHRPLPVYRKSAEQRAAIRHTISSNILFSGLESEMLVTVIDAMFEKEFAAGECIIRQGDPGDLFFVVFSGTCDCYLKVANEPAKLVKVYEPGEAFGELALMYNAPRAASIHARTRVVLLAMDRLTFRRALMQQTSAKRKIYESFLATVPILNSLDKYERAKIADVLQEQWFEPGDFVIKQGDSGTNFYIVEQGEAVCLKTIDGITQVDPMEVMTYHRGAYFGELALLHGKPRAASICAKTKLKCITLDRASFVRMMGSVESILTRNTKRYKDAEASIKSKFSAAKHGRRATLKF